MCDKAVRSSYPYARQAISNSSLNLLQEESPRRLLANVVKCYTYSRMEGELTSLVPQLKALRRAP
jgi:hypothetical protein